MNACLLVNDFDSMSCRPQLRRHIDSIRGSQASPRAYWAKRLRSHLLFIQRLYAVIPCRDSNHRRQMTLLMKQTLYRPSHHGWFLLNCLLFTKLYSNIQFFWRFTKLILLSFKLHFLEGGREWNGSNYMQSWEVRLYRNVHSRLG